MRILLISSFDVDDQYDDGDDHLTSAYDVASAQQPVSLLLPNGWKGFVDAE